MAIKYFSPFRLADTVKGEFGTSGDLQIRHDSTNSEIVNLTGHLTIENKADDKDIIFKSDDGSGGVAEYFSVDGSITQTKFSKSLLIKDNVFANFGDSNDFSIVHGGVNSTITNNTGDLTIKNTADDKDIIFQSDDGSGGVETYFFLDGSSSRTIFPDGKEAVFGTSSNLFLFHSTNSFIQNYTSGNFFIDQRVDDADLALRADDGSGGTTAYLTLDGSAAKTVFSKNTTHEDSVLGQFGSSNDLVLSHNGTDSFIDNFTGTLFIDQEVNDSDIVLRCDDGSGGVTAYITLDGSATTVEVAKVTNFAGHAKFDGGNFSIGSVSGVSRIQGNSDNDIRFLNSGDSEIANMDGATRLTTFNGAITVGADGAGKDAKFFLAASGRHIMVDADDNSLLFTDNANAKFGNGGDLQLLHDGTDSRIDNMVGHLKIRNFSDDSDIIFETDNGSGGTAEYLRFDGGQGFTIASKVIRFVDSISAAFGTDGDGAISHSGSRMDIVNTLGDLNIKNFADDSDIVFQSDDGSGGIETYFFLDGSNNFSQSLKHIRFADNASVLVGSSSDLSITHDGTNSIIANNTGNLQINQNVDDGDLILQCDDGSGGTTAYITLDGGLGRTNIHKRVRVDDNIQFQLGSDADIQFYHTGTIGILYNNTGDFRFRQNADDKDFVFQCDDGSGGVTDYIKIDGSAETTIFSKPLRVSDSVAIEVGSGADLQLSHNGTNSSIVNHVGHLNITNETDDGDITFNTDNGSGGTTEYFRIDGGSKQVRISEDFNFLDNAHADFGTSSDLKIYHDGSSSYIENNTGNLNIMTRADDADMVFWGDDGTGGDGEYFRIDSSLSDASSDFRYTVWPDRSVIALGSGSDLQLYHNSADSYVDNYAGDLYIRNTVDDKDIIFQSDDGSGGLATYITVDGSTNRVNFNKPIKIADNTAINVGSGLDLQISHDSSNSHVANYTGDLKITNNANDKDVILNCDDGSGGNTAYITLDGSVTTTKFDKQTLHSDNVEAIFGTGSDLKIKHNGTNTLIRNFTGDLTIRNANTDNDVILECDDGSGGTTAYVTLDGSTTKTVFNKPSQRTFAVSSTTDGDANGDIVFLGGTTSMTAGKIYHYKANGTWELADADSAVNCDGLLAVALGSASDTDGMLLRGMVTLDHDPGNLADVLFLSTTAGTATNTAPSGSGDIVRVIGYLLGGSNGQIYFNPDGTFVEVA